jgi:hypothetical protein
MRFEGFHHLDYLRNPVISGVEGLVSLEELVVPNFLEHVLTWGDMLDRFLM